MKLYIAARHLQLIVALSQRESTTLIFLPGDIHNLGAFDQVSDQANGITRSEWRIRMNVFDYCFKLPPARYTI